MASGPITSWQTDGDTMEKMTDFIFLGSKITADGDHSHEIKRHLLLGRKVMTNLDSIFKSRDIILPTKSCLVKAGFSCGHVWMWELDYEEDWALKNWCFWTVVLKKTLESPLDCKEIQPVSPKGNQPWIFTGRIDAEAEAPILWPPDVKNRLIGNDPDAGKDWGLEEKRTTEDEMVAWRHQLNGHEFEQMLEIMMDREAWHAALHGVAESWTWLSNWTFKNIFVKSYYGFQILQIYKSSLIFL